MSAVTKAKTVASYSRYSVDALRHASATDRQQRFVIYGLGRTGSTLLADLLNAHPQIHCDDEILHDHVRAPRLIVAAKATHATKPAYGFKLLTYHLLTIQRIKPPEFLDWLNHRGYRMVYLSRRNVLRQALSNIKADSHGYHFRDALPDAARSRLHVDVDVLAKWLDRIRRQTELNEQLVAQYPDALAVVYEDDLIDPDRQALTVARISGMLNLRQEPVSTSLMRAAPDRIDDLITNYDEVAAYLRGTQWEEFLAG